MPYFCAQCRVFWPCTNVRHNTEWSSKLWYPDGHQHSLPCFLFDHAECEVPLYCKCQCHRESILDEQTSAAPPANR